MDDQFPGSLETGFGFLGLPKLKVKAAVKIFNAPATHRCDFFFHYKFFQSPSQRANPLARF
jgi:hypothetical protein